MVKAGQENNYLLVTGQQVVDPATLTPEEWHQIIHSALEKITVEYLRGLVSLNALIEDRPNMPPTKFAVKAIREGHLLETFPGANLLFLATTRPLPSFDAWPRLPLS